MKKLFKLTTVIALAIVSIASLSAFKSEKKNSSANATSYSIVNIANDVLIGDGIYQWTWSVTNPNPGNGENGTLQDISHWSMPLPINAENSIMSAEYSFDGVNWISTSINIDRDPSIRFCTGADVLKFDVGTSGSQPTYYRVCLSASLNVNPTATSFIKTGGGQQGCNSYLFAGISNLPKTL